MDLNYCRSVLLLLFRQLRRRRRRRRRRLLLLLCCCCCCCCCCYYYYYYHHYYYYDHLTETGTEEHPAGNPLLKPNPKPPHPKRSPCPPLQSQLSLGSQNQLVRLHCTQLGQRLSGRPGSATWDKGFFLELLYGSCKSCIRAANKGCYNDSHLRVFLVFPCYARRALQVLGYRASVLGFKTLGCSPYSMNP